MQTISSQFTFTQPSTRLCYKIIVIGGLHLTLIICWDKHTQAIGGKNVWIILVGQGNMID